MESWDLFRSLNHNNTEQSLLFGNFSSPRARHDCDVMCVVGGGVVRRRRGEENLNLSKQISLSKYIMNFDCYFIFMSNFFVRRSVSFVWLFFLSTRNFPSALVIPKATSSQWRRKFHILQFMSLGLQSVWFLLSLRSIHSPTPRSVNISFLTRMMNKKPFWRSINQLAHVLGIIRSASSSLVSFLLSTTTLETNSRRWMKPMWWISWLLDANSWHKTSNINVSESPQTFPSNTS